MVQPSAHVSCDKDFRCCPPRRSLHLPLKGKEGVDEGRDINHQPQDQERITLLAHLEDRKHMRKEGCNPQMSFSFLLRHDCFRLNKPLRPAMNNGIGWAKDTQDPFFKSGDKKDTFGGVF
ncbi:hypothetical protein XENOCAPTIV_023063 [Xenoophorus captivus]|uniref:Uncharacterized protein n=1 Tax=Xenoophorus captivus TaxID=1517983 RepID=A0ABV0R336_9TELE